MKNYQGMTHIGFLLDVIGTPSPRVPVFLNGSGLKAHTAVIAQSGSGKSFMLGRYLEEIILKTNARVIILDPNSDFVQFSTINEDAWKDPKLKGWFTRKDSLAAFKAGWEKLNCMIYSNREEKSLGLKKPEVSIFHMSLSWERIDLFNRARHLGFDMASSPRELRVVEKAYDFMKKDCDRKFEKAGPTLKRFTDYAAAIWVVRENLTDTVIDPAWPYKRIDASSVQDISPDAAFSVFGRARELQETGIWDKIQAENSLDVKTKEFAQESLSSRIAIVDLASLPSRKGQLSVVSAILDSLWGGARELWGSVLSKKREDDNRCPTFVVIDEAHNIAPELASENIEKYVADGLLRIAAEGRKFGLFLVLVTQRPSRVHPALFSQCDNLCLLKINNLKDIDLVEKHFGFVPKGWAQRALQFEVGDALLSGSFVEQPVYTHIAPRRTVTGGRNLTDFFLKSS